MTVLRNRAGVGRKLETATRINSRNRAGIAVAAVTAGSRAEPNMTVEAAHPRERQRSLLRLWHRTQ